MADLVASADRQWEAVLQAVGHPVLVLDPQHRILTVNKAVLQATGLPEDQLIGQNCSMVFHGTAQPPPGCPLEKLRTSGHIETAEMEVQALGRTFMVSCTPLLDREGQIEKIIHIATDVTEQKKARQVLAQEKDMLEALFEASPSAIIVTDMQGRITRCNRTSLEMHGFTAKEEIVGRPMSILVASHHRDTLAQEFQGGVHLGPNSVRRMLLTRECQEFPAEVSSNVVRNAAGEPIAVIAVVQNVAKRELAEKTLQASEERYRALVETIPHGVQEIDPTGTILFTNPALNRILGYPLGELIGRKVWSLEAGDPKSLQTYIESLVRDHPRPQPYLSTWVTRGGHPIHVQIDWDYKWDEKENLAGFISIITDVTDHQRAERHIRRLNRVYAVLSDINQAIVRIRELQRLFEEACRIAVEKGGFRMAWVGLVNDATGKVESVAHAEVTDGYLDRLDILLSDEPRGGGPTVSALREGRHVVCNDIQHDPCMAPWREEALRLGYRSSAAFPLVALGQVWGTINLYAGEPGFFDDDELKLLDELAGDISFAMEFAQKEDRRRQAEEQLRQLASRHEAILSEVPDIIMEVDADKVYTWANPAGYEFFGPDVLGKEAAYFFEGEQDTYDEVKPLFNGDARVFYVESWQRRKDGQRRLLAWWCRALEDKAGRVTGALSTARDITEARQAEQLLKHEQARLESIFLAAPIGIGVVRNRVIQRANERLCVMTGYSKEELLERSARMLYPSQEEFERVGREKYDDIRKVGMGSIETQWRRKDGALIDIFLSSAPLDPKDWSVGVTFTALDITERKQAEQALRESEERFHLAVQGANEGLWDWPDMGQDRQWWSPRFYELLGYSPGEIEAMNSNFNRLVHPDDLERVRAVVQARMEEGRPFDIEYRLRMRSGEYHWFSSRGAVVRTPGKPIRMSGSIRDITEQRRAQIERVTYQTKLKSLTSQLALAEERERRRIAVGVHDDIGQKLVLAKLELQSLRQTISESGLAQGVDHVCNLIDQTMQDARSLAFDLSNPVLYEVGFDAAVEAWLNRQVERKTGIRCDFASEMIGTKLDETMAVALFQAVREVLTNVIKHAQAKTLKVYICKVKDQVQVTVEDDGVGFDPAGLEWSTESQRGLGLFNVKERMEYLKGHLEVRSTPGQGTTVILAVPFKAATSSRQRVSS